MSGVKVPSILKFYVEKIYTRRIFKLQDWNQIKNYIGKSKFVKMATQKKHTI